MKLNVFCESWIKIQRYCLHPVKIHVVEKDKFISISSTILEVNGCPVMERGTVYTKEDEKDRSWHVFSQHVVGV